MSFTNTSPVLNPTRSKDVSRFYQEINAHNYLAFSPSLFITYDFVNLKKYDYNEHFFFSCICKVNIKFENFNAFDL